VNKTGGALPTGTLAAHFLFVCLCFFFWLCVFVFVWVVFLVIFSMEEILQSFSDGKLVRLDDALIGDRVKGYMLPYQLNTAWVQRRQYKELKCVKTE
jgi:hypothetical protein